ncbi:MAG: hypothetical protein GY835_10570 [bacterium]|nr:hypothetical protein [bacterium]
MNSKTPTNTTNGDDYHITADLCLDLLHNLLSLEDRQRALTHMAECKDCEESVRVQFSKHLHAEVAVNSAMDRYRVQIEQGEPVSVSDRSVSETRMRYNLNSDASSRRNSNSRTFIWACLGTLAALFVLLISILALPPRPGSENMIRRTGSESYRILRPIAGEITLSEPPTFSWTPIEGASSYNLSIEAAGGGFKWSGRCEETEMMLPRNMSLPVGERFHIFLDPIPAYTTSPQGVASSFRTGTMDQFLIYRLRAASRWSLVPGLIALLLLMCTMRSGLLLRSR